MNSCHDMLRSFVKSGDLVTIRPAEYSFGLLLDKVGHAPVHEPGLGPLWRVHHDHEGVILMHEKFIKVLREK